ncbi:MAG: hypothetical protein JWN43_755 [Gammaproteobacteria bacterium]|nr:hypothetical protein [Gammaproteobacteria bacterium]
MDTTWISRRISTAPHLSEPTVNWRTAASRLYYGKVATSSKPRTPPAFVTPMAAQSVAELPEGDDWIYELKLDGSPYSGTVSSKTGGGMSP